MDQPSFTSEEAPPNRLAAWVYPLLLLILFISSILLYSNTFDGWLFFSWDDNRYIEENTLIRDFGPAKIEQIFTEPYFAAYIPITISSYGVEFTLWGMDPTGYHVVNVILHAFNVLLVLAFIDRFQSNRWVAVFTAVLFMVHPLQVENVAWVSQRKSLLAMFFLLLALITHLQATKTKTKNSWIALAWLFFLLSILSKPTAVFAPLLFMLMDYFWSQKSPLAIFVRSVPYWFIGVVGAILIIKAHDEYGGIKEPVSQSILVRIGMMANVFWDYAVSFVNPFRLNNLYYYNASDITVSNPSVWLGLVLILAMAVFALWRFWENPYRLFAAAWVGVMMLPVSNIIPIAIQRADRYMYFPSIVVFMLLGMGMAWVWEQARAIEYRYVLVAVASGLVVFFTVLTFQRNQIWLNEDTLWEEHLKTYPQSETGILNRGVHFYRLGQNDIAADLFRELVSYYPNHYKGNLFLGNIARSENDFETASFYYVRAYAIRPNEPGLKTTLVDALVKAGIAANERRDYQIALDYYEQALTLSPQEPAIYNNAGFTYYQSGRTAEAITAYTSATTLKPDYVLAWANLGNAAARAENFELVVQAYQQVLTLGGGLTAEGASNYCLAIGELQGNADEALAFCNQAITAEPENALFLGRAAHVLLLYDRALEALPLAQATVAANPNSALGYRTLGDSQARLGEVDAARTAYIQALALDPNNKRAQAGLEALGG